MWGRHTDGITSKWTSLFPGNVPLLENVWLPWQLPSQWHSWSLALTAIIPSQSSTPRLPGSGLVSIFSRRSSTQGKSQEGGRDGTAVLQSGVLRGVLLATFLVPVKHHKERNFILACGLRQRRHAGKSMRQLITFHPQ